ncbi:MAG: nucleotidyltransferase family protein [Proteobacteria bacterium]|nr:MAG: nucleotidyltransferase family protein [Pseudomonadota bacterium]
MVPVTCACLAAGRSSRMKGDHKLLKIIGNNSVISHVGAQLSELSLHELVVVTGGESEIIEALLKGFPLRILKNPDFAKGMHSSVRQAILNMDPESKALVICLGDQPFDLKQRMIRLLDAGNITTETLRRSSVEGKPGHPVIIGRRYFDRILAQPDGDYGCAYLFKEFSFESVEQGASALWDLDTQEDFDRYAHLLNT